jgi:alkylation response protein AidB-like acyl-CoA dehydrogenase
MAYTAPISDYLQILRAFEAGGSNSGLDAETAEAVLTEAGRLASGPFAECNEAGDRIGAKLTDAGVKTAPGFADAYAAFRDGGWIGLPFPEEHGGQGLPKTLATAVFEMLQSANMSLSLCPMLSLGAIDALIAHGDAQQQERYLPKLISGEWTGTMNLTEPQAGSDVGALTTRATPNGDGTYDLHGQKIFITWGDHDVADNIVHLVLARLPDAPAGSRGVSLFLCPKVMTDLEGRPGERNKVQCIALESKIGIHGSPTCVMAYAGARATLIGAPNKGLAAMFTMMNSARLNVGVQGPAVGESAFQTALAYAKDRKQGQAESEPGSAAIIRHPDVFRMLAIMRAKTLAARALCLACAAAADAGDESREGLLTPIVKAWSTDVGVEVASLGVQVHGGMGFMNETAAAQAYRDARIAPIYEGTNGIQAIDLIGRKLGNDGAPMLALIAEIDANLKRAKASSDADLVAAASAMAASVSALADATHWIVAAKASDRTAALYSATAYQTLAGDVLGGYLLIRCGLAGGSPEMSALSNVFVQEVLANPADPMRFRNASAALQRLHAVVGDWT